VNLEKAIEKKKNESSKLYLYRQVGEIGEFFSLVGVVEVKEVKGSVKEFRADLRVKMKTLLWLKCPCGLESVDRQPNFIILDLSDKKYVWRL
jgi:hypothetical protein